MSCISEKIKKYRKEKGYTQEELAKAAGVSVMSIRRYESGERSPRLDILSNFAEIFETNIDELISSDIYQDETGYVHIGIGGYDTSFSLKNGLLFAFDKLNSIGKEEAVKRVEELTEIEKYKK